MCLDLVQWLAQKFLLECVPPRVRDSRRTRGREKRARRFEGSWLANQKHGPGTFTSHSFVQQLVNIVRGFVRRTMRIRAALINNESMSEMRKISGVLSSFCALLTTGALLFWCGTVRLLQGSFKSGSCLDMPVRLILLAATAAAS